MIRCGIVIMLAIIAAAIIIIATAIAIIAFMTMVIEACLALTKPLC